MKRILMLIMVTLAFAASAQAKVEVQFTPANPGPCTGDFYFRSSTLKVLGVRDSAESIQVALRVNYFACHGQYAPKEITQDPAKLVTLLKDEFTWPWSAMPNVGIKVKLPNGAASTFADVTLKFDKSEILEGKSSGSKSYLFYFSPTKMRPEYNFLWTAEIEIDAAKNAKLRLTQGN